MKIKSGDTVYIPVKITNTELACNGRCELRLDDPKTEATAMYEKTAINLYVNKSWLEQNVKWKTNLEHYGADILTEWNIANNEQLLLNMFFKKYNIPKFDSTYAEEFYKWLLQPYQRPKYPLTKAEYDLLDVAINKNVSLKDWWTTDMLISKGYFKNIPTGVPIKDILDNCDVSDNDQ